MSLLKELLRKTEKIDFLFPNSFEELMNSEYYDYDKFEWFLYYAFKLDPETSKVDKVGKKGKGDGGADIIVSIHQKESIRRIGVQAKYWKNRVGAQPINQLASAKQRLDLTDLWLITTSDLTSDAKEIAESLKIKILRAEDVAQMINVVKERYKSDIEKDGESSIEFLKPIKKEKEVKQNIKVEEKEGEDELVLQLKNLRTEISKKYNLYPVYNVFNNETLNLIIEQKPSTVEDLVNIKGIGSKKAEIFGAEIIDFVNSKLIKKAKPSFEVDQKLLELLLVERSKIAKFNKLTEDDVYTDKVAGYIAKMKPKDRETLSKVYGFRKENIDVFGDYLLKVISKYLEATK